MRWEQSFVAKLNNKIQKFKYHIYSHGVCVCVLLVSEYCFAHGCVEHNEKHISKKKSSECCACETNFKICGALE